MHLKFHIGIRSEKDTKIFLKSLFKKHKNIKTVHSDAYKPYIKQLKSRGVEHTTTKNLTTHIESLNSVLRHRLSSFNRRSRNIAKKLENLSAILNLFFYRYILKYQLG